MAGGRKLRVSCGPVATFNPSKQEAKGGSDEAQDSIVLSMSNELLYLVPELHTQCSVWWLCIMTNKRDSIRIALEAILLLIYAWNS